MLNGIETDPRQNKINGEPSSAVVFNKVFVNPVSKFILYFRIKFQKNYLPKTINLVDALACPASFVAIHE